MTLRNISVHLWSRLNQRQPVLFNSQWISSLDATEQTQTERREDRVGVAVWFGTWQQLTKMNEHLISSTQLICSWSGVNGDQSWSGFWWLLNHDQWPHVLCLTGNFFQDSHWVQRQLLLYYRCLLLLLLFLFFIINLLFFYFYTPPVV